jgi:hypothetical protein
MLFYINYILFSHPEQLQKIMKTLGRKSLSSVLGKIITVVFYLEFLLVLTLPLVFLDEDGLRYSWPITLRSDTSQPFVSTQTPGISGFIIHERYNEVKNSSWKTLSFEDGSLGRKLLQSLHNVVTIAAILLITFWLKNYFPGLPKTDHLTPEIRIGCAGSPGWCLGSCCLMWLKPFCTGPTRLPPYRYQAPVWIFMISVSMEGLFL